MARVLTTFLGRLRLIKIFILILSIFAVLEIAKTFRKREPPYSLSTARHFVFNIKPTIINITAKEKPPNAPTTISTPTLSSKLDACELPAREVGFRSSTLARRFPHIIIIGFGKAGTRALYQMIRMHPDIAAPSEEIRFFSNDVNYKRGLSFYFGQLPTSNALQKTMVKSPNYIISPVAASRLKKALSHCDRNKVIKFIVVLRDPFKRAVSEYLQWKKYLYMQLKRTLPPFEKLCVKKSGMINNLNKQVNASIYSHHLENWLKYFTMKQICFVNGEVLVKEPYFEVKKLEKCLELRNFIQPKHFYFNKMKGYYCPVDSQGNPKCLPAAKGRTHPNINKEIERKLRNFYEPYNKRLYNITGVDYQWT